MTHLALQGRGCHSGRDQGLNERPSSRRDDPWDPVANHARQQDVLDGTPKVFATIQARNQHDSINNKQITVDTCNHDETANANAFDDRVLVDNHPPCLSVCRACVKSTLGWSTVRRATSWVMVLIACLTVIFVGTSLSFGATRLIPTLHVSSSSPEGSSSSSSRPNDTLPGFVAFKKSYQSHAGNTRLLQAMTRQQVSLAEIIAQVFVLQLLEAYLGFAHMIPEISGQGPYTFMTPWDTPLSNLDEALIDKLQNKSWRAHLRNLLEYHLYWGDIALDDLLEASQTITMANGEDVIITRIPGTRRIRVNGVLVVADYDATNGHAYMVDEVLLPTWVSRVIEDVLSTEFSVFTSLLEQARLDLSSQYPDNSFTVFAPTDSAFMNLGQDLLEFLQSPAGDGLLQNTLEYHVVFDPLPSINFVSDLPADFTTLNGNQIEVSSGSPVTIKGLYNQASMLSRLDLLAYNGIVHAIDAVLLVEPGATSSPTAAPVSSTDRPTATSTLEPLENLVLVPGDFVQGPDADANFGSAVALSRNGRIMVVGAPSYARRLGRVDIYELVDFPGEPVPRQWVQKQVIEGTIVQGTLGQSVAVSWDGLVVAVSEPGANRRAGRVMVYNYTADSESYQALGSPIFGSAEASYSGTSLSLTSDGLRVAVGAPYYSGVNNLQLHGQVIVYELDGGEWIPMGNPIWGGDRLDWFGSAVALSDDGTRFVASAPRNSNVNGYVGAWQWNSEARDWIPWGGQIYNNYLPALSSDRFGHSVALSTTPTGTYCLAVGIPWKSVDGARNAGMAVVFELNPNGNQWIQLGEPIVEKTPELHEEAGSSIDLVDGRILLIGAPGAVDRRGLVRLYRFDERRGTWEVHPFPLMGSDRGDDFGVALAAQRVEGRLELVVGAISQNSQNFGYVHSYHQTLTTAPSTSPIALQLSASPTLSCPPSVGSGLCFAIYDPMCCGGVLFTNECWACNAGYPSDQCSREQPTECCDPGPLLQCATQECFSCLRDAFDNLIGAGPPDIGSTCSQHVPTFCFAAQEGCTQCSDCVEEAFLFSSCVALARGCASFACNDDLP